MTTPKPNDETALPLMDCCAALMLAINLIRHHAATLDEQSRKSPKSILGRMAEKSAADAKQAIAVLEEILRDNGRAGAVAELLARADDMLGRAHIILDGWQDALEWHCDYERFNKHNDKDLARRALDSE